MSNGNDNHWYSEGRSGGSRPEPGSSDRALDKYNEGKAQREVDRTVNEALEKLHNPNSGSKY